MGNREEVIVNDAKKMIRQPLQLIEIVLLKHQEAVLEVCKEQQEKIDHLEPNAARYFWLRDWLNNGGEFEGAFTKAVRKTNSRDEFDAAIDAAMKGELK